MTADRNRSPEDIERILAQAHRARPTISVGKGWTHEVMRTIRQDAAESPSLSKVAWAEPLVWRVAAGA